MKGRSTLLSLIALGLALVASAAPNLSGTWVLDKSKSDPIRMGRGADSGGPRPDVNITLVIKQNANDLAIVRTMNMGGNDRTSEQKFTLDGKECTNPSSMGRGEFTGKAQMKNGRLVIEGNQKVSTPNGDFEIGVKDEYTLSEDGKSLTVNSTRSTPMGDRTSKQVYNKK